MEEGVVADVVVLFLRARMVKKTSEKPGALRNVTKSMNPGMCFQESTSALVVNVKNAELILR
jgi:hypothetical protein